MSCTIEPFDIFIRGNSGKTYVIYVWSSTTVADMKVLFHVKSSEPLENMVFSYQGKLLKDTDTVEFLKIKKESHLFSCNRIIGGGEDRLVPICGYTGSNEPNIFGF
jgi:hypothetical protein